MATRHYESVVILNASLEDSQIEGIIKSIQNNITTHGGELTDTENWGRKRLAYNIDNAKTGYYLVQRFIGLPSMISEFERNLKLDENVIRFLTIALDKKALEYLSNAASRAEDQASEQEAADQQKTTTQTETTD